MENNHDSQYSLRKEISEKADIVKIISQYVTLEKKGANYIGLCPFHDDKNPSMSVSPSKHIFKCFSCNAGGDSITFLSKIKNISQLQAMREIAETLGINVPITKKEVEQQKNKKYYQIMADATQFFHFFLKNTEDGKDAISYLQKRKLSNEIIDHFNIGLSPKNNELYDILSNQHHHLPLDMLEVAIIKSGNDYYDTFKNRIMFPLKDLDGNYVGFSGRIYQQSDEAKYINTPDTIIFKKGNILYNYSDSVQAIRNKDCVYLFEGFMDVIASYRAGVTNAVASMGTALTNEQIIAIHRLTNNVIVCYDNDGPGIEATKRAINMLLSHKMNVKTVRIPDGKDPDEYIFKNGEEALNKVLTTQTISAMEYLYQLEKVHLVLTDVNEIESFKNKIFSYLPMFQSNLVVETYIKKMANDIQISYDALISDYKNVVSTKIDYPQEYNNKNNNSYDNNLNNQPVVIKQPKSKKKYLKSERKLIVASYNEQEKCLYIENQLENNFVDKINREILFKIRMYYQKHNQMIDQEFQQALSEDEWRVLREILEDEEIPNGSEIEILINNVKEWPYVKAANQEALSENKTIEGINRLSSYKKAITRIKKGDV